MALMKTVILKRTKSVAAKEGFNQFSVRSVAQECGCSEGLIFHHFSTKKNLLDVCYRCIIDDVNDAIRSEIDGKRDLQSVFYSFCGFMRRNREAALFCLGYYKNNDGVMDGLEVIKGSIRDMFPGYDDDVVSSMTKEAAVIGCLYGAGVIVWDKGRKEDYRRFVIELIGGGSPEQGLINNCPVS